MGFGRWPLRLTSGPAIPENFAVELTSTSNVANFNITWTNTETPESYTIYYKTSAAATFTKITGITTLSYSLSTGLLNNTDYDIYITAVNGGRESRKTSTRRQTFYLYPVKPTYTFTYEHLGYTVSWTNPTSPAPPSTQTHTLYYTEIGSNTVDTTALTFAKGSKNLTSLLAGTKTNGKQYACYVTITNGSFTRTENIGPISGAPFADGGNSTITIYAKPDINTVTLTATPSYTSVSIAVATVSTTFSSGTTLKIVNGYRLYNGTTILTTVDTTPISRTGLTTNISYTYGVSLFNNFGIESDKKNVTFKTLSTKPTTSPIVGQGTVNGLSVFTISAPTEIAANSVVIYETPGPNNVQKGTFLFSQLSTLPTDSSKYYITTSQVSFSKMLTYGAAYKNTSTNEIGTRSNTITWY